MTERHDRPSSSRLKPAIFFLLTMLAGLWPLLVYGQPSYIQDSSSYYRGGQAAWERASDLLPSPTVQENSTGTHAAEARAPDPSNTVGVRSLAYSGLTFILSGPRTTLLPLVLVQTAVAALLLWLLLRVLESTTWPWIIAVPAIVGAATSFPVFATLATPDLWAGLMLLCTILGLFGARLSRLEQLFITATLAFAVASHASHILLAICLLGSLLILAVVPRLLHRNAIRPSALTWPALGLIGGLLISFLLGLVAFGEASPVPKRYPYALARAIEDGPARWYLQENCPKERYTVCELFPDDIPGGVGDFLWSERGLAQRATPEQMERIRAEEPVILSRAFAAYPWFQIEASTRNVLRQFGMISIAPDVYQNRTMDELGYLHPRDGRPTHLSWNEPLQRYTIFLSLLILLTTFARTPLLLRCAVGLTFSFIVVNDLICAILSAPDVRYQSRMLWVLPILASVTAMRLRTRGLAQGDDRAT